jgi:hypothetical protein
VLLQVVADYERLSAALAAGRAGHERASGPQYSGVAGDCYCAGVATLHLRRSPSSVTRTVTICGGRPVPSRPSSWCARPA